MTFFLLISCYSYYSNHGVCMLKGEKIAIGISAMALIVSILNMALTSPVLIDIYSSPEIAASEVHREFDGDTFRTRFVAKNTGAKSAKNVILTLSAHSDDIIQVAEGFTGDVSETPNGPYFKTVTIKTDYLARDDDIWVFVTGKKENLVSLANSYNMDDGSPSNISIPAIVSIKSERGMGTRKNLAAWFQVNVK